MSALSEFIRSCDADDFASLLSGNTGFTLGEIHREARLLTDKYFGKGVYIRGLIEFSNYCDNNCFYCGIRHSNKKLSRYRMTEKEILDCCQRGYQEGIRTFVLQGGEDLSYGDDVICHIVESINYSFPDCAITLSVGEREKEIYHKFYAAGACRYLLRHETADCDHYKKLHPSSMSYSHRIQCLYDLKSIGYQTGCGMMVGSPYQTPENLCQDLVFIRDFAPAMVGIGPFLPQEDTPFKNRQPGSRELTLLLLSILRIMLPDLLLPSTTALGCIGQQGFIDGLNAGANVIMVNLTPIAQREQYKLYNGKKELADTSPGELRRLLEENGYGFVIGRGDACMGKVKSEK